MEVKYIKPAKLGDSLIIKSQIVETEPALVIKYAIYNKTTKDKIFSASTIQIAVNIKTMESVYTPPEKLLKALEECKH